MKAVIIWRNSRSNCYIDSYKSWKKKNLSLRKQSVCWFLVNNHVIFNVLCKYCQSLIFLFSLITIFCTLWKKINLKNKTMNCFLFYFQQPITTLNKMSYKCQVSQFGSAVDSKSYGRNYGKQTWTKYFWGLPNIHKTVTVNKINNKIQKFPQNKAKFHQNDNLEEIA